MKRFLRLAATTALGAVALAVALTATLVAPTPARAAETLTVVATTGMIADTARRIGGDQATVEALMGPGVDPHAFRQTRSDIVKTATADLVLWHGLYLEAQLEDFLRDLAERRRVVAVAEALPKDVLLGHDDYADKFDPHVWMNPTLWAGVTERVLEAMIEAKPEAEAAFRANAAAFLAELEATAAYAETTLGTVPEESRVLVTAHDAFNYFGATYGFEVIGIQGISTASEAGLKRIGALVDLLVSRDVKAVFVESSVSDRNIRALIEGAAARGHTVAIGGELFSDAMGAEGTYEGTFLGMLDHNATVITRALGGAAPEGGRLGKLGS